LARGLVLNGEGRRLVVILSAAVAVLFGSATASGQSPPPVFLVSGNAPGDATGFFSGDDDRPGIQAAIDAAILWLEDSANSGGGPASVVFEAGGTYHLDSTNPIRPAYSLLIQDLRGNTDRLQLLGNNSTIVHRQLLNQTLGIRGSGLVLVQDLTFDRDPLPYMDGTVEAVNGNLVTIRQVRGLSPLLFPPVGSAPSTIRHWGWLLDPTTPGRPKSGTATFYEASSITQSTTDPDLYDFVLESMGDAAIPDDFTVGDRFSYHYREGGNNIQIRGSANIEVRNATSYAASAMFVNADDTDSLTVIDSRVAIRPGLWRSTNGDGVHVKRGNDLVIENCSFAGVSDDAINITEVVGFSVTNNTFLDKRRHAILFDADNNGGNPPNSTLGLVQGNYTAFNGGSFISHKGGDYATVTIELNDALNNNLTRALTANHHVRLIAGVGGLAAAGTIGADGLWGDGDEAGVAAELAAADRAWHIQKLSDGRVLIINRAARDANTWLYLAPASSAPDAGENVLLRPPQAQNNPSENHWAIEPFASTELSRIRYAPADAFANPALDLYLTLEPSAAVAAAGDNLGLAPLDPTDPYQLWRIEYLEDPGPLVSIPALGGVGLIALAAGLAAMAARRLRKARPEESGVEPTAYEQPRPGCSGETW